MIDLALVPAAATAVYAVAFAALLVRLRGVPEALARYTYPVVGVVGLATVATALSTAGIGTVPVGGGEVDVPSVFDDLVSYSVLWVVATMLADDSRRTLALFGAIPAIQVLAFSVASVVGGVVGLLGLFVVVAGHFVIAYLLFGSVWDRAADRSDAQRLLHWKGRNLLLFTVGMLIIFALLSVAGVFDAFVTAVIAEYIALMIRVGFAGFLFVNLDAIETRGPRSPDSAAPPVADATGSD